MTPSFVTPPHIANNEFDSLCRLIAVNIKLQLLQDNNLQSPHAYWCEGEVDERSINYTIIVQDDHEVTPTKPPRQLIPPLQNQRGKTMIRCNGIETPIAQSHFTVSKSLLAASPSQIQ
jgi:hypothetical protein